MITFAKLPVEISKEIDAYVHGQLLREHQLSFTLVKFDIQAMGAFTACFGDRWKFTSLEQFIKFTNSSMVYNVLLKEAHKVGKKIQFPEITKGYYILKSWEYENNKNKKKDKCTII